MKWVILFLLLIPSVNAIEVSVPELFDVPAAIEGGKETYFYVGNNLVFADGDYVYNNRLGSNLAGKSLPFGEEINSDARFSFTGKELDSDLYYFGARYYDSNLGRFVSVDPVEENHPYSYVENNPLMYIDPNGMNGLNIVFSEGGYRDMILHNIEQTARTIQKIEEGLPGGPIIFEDINDPNLENYMLPENGIFREQMESLKGVGPRHYQEMVNKLGLREYTSPDRDNPEIARFFTEIGVDYYADDDNKWCAACLTDTLRVSGNIYPTGEQGIRALNFAGRGYNPPERPYGLDVHPGAELVGDIVVVNSHIGYFAGRFSNGDILMLGGNQNNRVSFKKERRAPVDIRRPISREMVGNLVQFFSGTNIPF